MNNMTLAAADNAQLFHSFEWDYPRFFMSTWGISFLTMTAALVLWLVGYALMHRRLEKKNFFAWAVLPIIVFVFGASITFYGYNLPINSQSALYSFTEEQEWQTGESIWDGYTLVGDPESEKVCDLSSELDGRTVIIYSIGECELDID